MLVGLAAIFWLVARSMNPLTVAEPWAPLHRLPLPPSSLVALLVSLPCLAIMWFGATLITREKAVLEANQRETQDRLRRVREYGSNDERIEPFIGSTFDMDDDEREPR